MAACMTPFYKRHQVNGKWMAFPCGMCYICKMRRVNGWAFRLDIEFKFSQSAHFLTFTYNTDHIPITPAGLLSLEKRDIQLMFKRIRKAGNFNSGKTGFRYFLCGEYGSKTQRPHYHALIFDCDLAPIEDQWRFGTIHRGDVEMASTYYSLKYMCKEAWNPRPGDDRAPEFQLMSKGIGDRYITPQMIAWHHAQLRERYYLPLNEGVKCPMPRYYKDRIYDDLQKGRISNYIAHLISLDEPMPDSVRNELVMAQNRKLKRTQLNTDYL